MVTIRHRRFAAWCATLLLAVVSVKGEGFYGKVWDFFTGKPSASAPAAEEEGASVNSGVIYRFFDEQFPPGGFTYGYPEDSKVSIDEDVWKNGEVALRFDLVAGDYSGGSVCLYNMVYDLRPILKKAALHFWIRGALGDESTMVALVDEDKTDGRKTVVRVRINNWFGQVTREWTLISIPLAYFERLNERGVYYDERLKKEIPDDFDWDKVAEFRIESRKNENKSFRIWVDDVYIVGLDR